MRENKYRYENALSSLRRDDTRVGNKMSLLPSIDFELASRDSHRRIRNKRRLFGFQDLLVTHESDESFFKDVSQLISVQRITEVSIPNHQTSVVLQEEQNPVVGIKQQ